MAPTRASVLRVLRTVVLGFLGLCVASALVEHVLEMRDTARLTASDTFSSLHGRRVRYRLTGVGEPGPTVVLLCGLVGSLEQWEHVQDELSASSPVLSYDRAGLGFSDPSDGHDANGQADELDQLLHAQSVSPPYVLVSYSSTASLARVFTALHPERVQGLVFLDPTAPDAIRTMPSSHRFTYRRNFAKSMSVNMLASLFGYIRFKQAAVSERETSPALERSNAILASFHHWLATAQEVWDLDRSDDEARATPWFGSMPVGVLSSFDPGQSELNRYVVAGNRDLASKSTRGIWRAGAHLGHDKVLADPVLYEAVVDLIRTILDETRAPMPAASPP
jgi:pimeloyl-ACP methyl ester carboxylesterase